MESTFTDRMNHALACYPGLPPGISIGPSWLADQVGVTRQVVSHWRAGRVPSLEQALRIAVALKVEPAWLAWGIGPMRPVSAQAASEAAETVARWLAAQQAAARPTG